MGRVGAGVTVRGYGGQEDDVTASMAENVLRARRTDRRVVASKRKADGVENL